MRNISQILVSAYNDNNVDLVFCLHAFRGNNLLFAFNSSDESVFITPKILKEAKLSRTLPTLYEANPGINVSEWVSLAENSKSTIDIETIFDTNIYFEAQRYETDVSWLCEYFMYERNVGEVVPLTTGYVSDITFTNSRMSFEIRSLTDFLSRRNLTQLYSTKDRYSLEDHGIAANWTFQGTISVVDVNNNRSNFSATINMPISARSGEFNFGKITVSTGANAGITRTISTSIYVSSVSLWQLRTLNPFPSPLSANVTFEVTSGYDRTWTQAKNKFNITREFRGEPFIPKKNRVINNGIA